MLSQKYQNGIELYKDKKDLECRINLQEKYGTNDLNQWILKKLKLQPGDRVLDIGCGNGNQLVALLQEGSQLRCGFDQKSSLNEPQPNSRLP